MIQIKRHSELVGPEKDIIDKMAAVAFEGVTIVQNTVWSTPDWCVINYQDQEIAMYFNVVERLVSFDGLLLKVAGINNVITQPAFQGKNFASSTLKHSEEFLFKTLKASYALLLCGDELVDFYSKLGWRLTRAKLLVHQPGIGEMNWASNTMLLNPIPYTDPKLINLNGLPW